MFNSDLLNSSLLNSSNITTSPNEAVDNIVYNGFSLTGLCSGSENTMVQTSNHRNLAQVDLKTYDYPRIDGGTVLGKKYSKRVIEMSIFLKADSNSELEEMIDTLKYRTSETNGILDINFGNTRRQINVTIISIEIPNFSKLDTTIEGIKLVFESYDPNFRGVSTSYKTLTSVSSNLTSSLNNQGTAESIPSYYLTFQSGISGLSDINISLGGYTLSINTPILDGDVVIFDSENFSVTQNGVELEFDGIFIELPVGITPIDFTFTPGSTFLVDINVIWNKNYL